MRKGLIAAFLISLVLVLAACGGNNNNANTNDNSATDNSTVNNDLDVAATDWEFDQDEYTVKSGEEVSVNLTSEEGMHGLAIDEFDVNIEGDGEASFTPDEPGEYTIYCSVPCGEGHDDMESTLIVE